MIFPLAFVLVLAQSLPPVHTMAPAPSPSAIDMEIRRAPIPFSPPANAAIIEDSGSTNYAGFKIAVSPNGDALYQTASGTHRGTIKRATAKWLFSHLAKNRPLSQLKAGECVKSVSFGTKTTIAWEAQTTPDLSCGGDPKVRELYRTAGVIQKQLGIVPERRGLRYPQ